MKKLIASPDLFPDLKDIVLDDDRPTDINIWDIVHKHNLHKQFGEKNGMYGLKGSSHPASQWVRTDEYRENVRNGVLTKQWKDNDARRESHSKKMSETWANNYEHMAENARNNGRHGLRGKEIHNTLDIEYKGVVYYGWNELKEATGVSKHLYKKYYVRGIDPEPRIGKDGPVIGSKYK